MRIHLYFTFFVTFCFGFELAVGEDQVTGIILPRDDEGMYVFNDQGQHEVRWTPDTEVALLCNTRQFSGLNNNQLEYTIHSSNETLVFSLPKGPVTAIKPVRPGRDLLRSLQEAKDEKWISERDLQLYFNEVPAKEQLPSEQDPHFYGVWDSSTNPRSLSINGTDYEISLKKGGQTTAVLYNVLSTEDCRPFVNQATVFGRREGNLLVAREIHILPIGDQAASDDSKLPRYLFIGDSISGNYDHGLRKALSGKFNIHHPPTNCGPSRKGAEEIVNWLGAYEEPSRGWDVISFNHGHWDSGSDQTSYQRNLEKVIAEMKKTGAKLVWVTTCPVPNGYPSSGPLDPQGGAPGRTAGVMKNYINKWAAEVIARHPKISTCDQWQFVKDNKDGVFSEWWQGKNVHFRGAAADALGEYLAEHIESLEIGDPQ